VPSQVDVPPLHEQCLRSHGHTMTSDPPACQPRRCAVHAVGRKRPRIDRVAKTCPQWRGAPGPAHLARPHRLRSSVVLLL